MNIFLVGFSREIILALGWRTEDLLYEKMWANLPSDDECLTSGDRQHLYRAITPHQLSFHTLMLIAAVIAER